MDVYCMEKWNYFSYPKVGKIKTWQIKPVTFKTPQGIGVTDLVLETKNIFKSYIFKYVTSLYLISVIKIVWTELLENIYCIEVVL